MGKHHQQIWTTEGKAKGKKKKKVRTNQGQIVPKRTKLLSTNMRPSCPAEEVPVVLKAMLQKRNTEPGHAALTLPRDSKASLDEGMKNDYQCSSKLSLY